MKELNARQERFCQALVGGMSATQAYVDAGFKAKDARQAASQLLTNINVKARLDELRASTAQAAQKSREDILRDLGWGIDKAKENGSVSDLVRAVAQYSKMCGYDAPAKVEADLTVNRIEWAVVDPRA